MLRCHYWAGVVLSVALGLVSTSLARAQAFGEQSPEQFRFTGQGATYEYYRVQLGVSQQQVSATSSINGSASAGGGPGGQGSSNLNNAVQLSPTTTLNLNVSGSQNVLNVSGDSVSATQNSSGSSQTSGNSQTTTSTKGN